MKFNFRLQRLLELREAAERQQASALHAAAHQEATERDAAQASEERLDMVEDQLRSSTDEVRAAGLYHVYGLTQDAARQQRDAQDEALRDAEAARTAEEARYQEARMARRAVERLRERREEEWETETGRLEQKDMDEVAQRQTRPGGESA